MSELIPLIIHINFWFLISLLKKRNDIADVGWGLGFTFLALFHFSTNPQALLAFSLVLIWSLRLSGFIFVRSLGSPEDSRYQDMRNGWKKLPVFQAFIKVFWLQGILLFILAQPLLQVMKYPHPGPLRGVDFFAALIALSGLLIEAIADQQKYNFKKLPGNQSALMTQGLWKYARHPNYFGEIVFWIGITLFSVTDLNTIIWIWISPTLLTILLVKVSGVPLIQKKNEKRAEFAEYKKKTNMLIPVPLKIFKN